MKLIIFIIILSILIIIVNNYYEIKYFIDLMNFISNTRYCPKTFIDIDEMLEFLKNARKYSSLISDDKYELESRNPFDLVNHIKDMENYTFSNITFGIIIYFIK